MRNCSEFVLSWFALAHLGAVMVPSNPAHTERELQHTLGRSRARVAIVDAEFQASVRTVIDRDDNDCTSLVVARASGEVGDGAVRFDSLLEHQPSNGDSFVASPGDPLEILFTSGTTAEPKGVVTTQANALWMGESTAKGMCLDGDRCLTALPLFHINAQAVTVLAALTAAGSVVVLEVFKADRFIDQLVAHHATHTSLVAQQAVALLAQEPSSQDRAHRVRRVAFGINVPDDTKEEFERRFGFNLTQVYGLSEASGIVTMSPVHRPQGWPSIGVPAPGRAIRIVDDGGVEVPPGEIGELQVQGIPGRTLMLEYFENAEETSKVLKEGWLSTGDAAWVDKFGYVYFFERIKDVIKSSGENVSASEVEAVVNSHPAVFESAVIGVEDERRGEAVLVFVVLEPGLELSAEDLVEFCSTRLARYKVPRFAEFVPALPRTPVGKIEKRTLRAQAAVTRP